jgi:hypothetical protein
VTKIGYHPDRYLHQVNDTFGRLYVPTPLRDYEQKDSNYTVLEFSNLFASIRALGVIYTRIE